MTADDKIGSLTEYRGIRPLKEGTVFAKFRVKKKFSKKEEKTEEEKPILDKDTKENIIDIEA
jgi:hypothetical protein